MKNLFVFVLLAAVFIATAQRFDNQNPFNRPRQNPSKLSSVSTTAKPVKPKSNVSCPEKNGRFPTRSCDSYIECADGYGEEKTCPDGLLFNAAASIFSYPCQYPIDVDCSGREARQQAQPTDDCPHQYGYYRMGGPAECGQFKNCVDGHSFVFNCPEGLAFDELTYRCDWPDLVDSCNAKEYLGFDCPAVDKGPDGRSLDEGIYTSYRSSKDCQKYFLCVNGGPRLHNCGEGRAFNELINACDGVENVTGCSSSGSSSPRVKIDPRFNQNRFH